MCFLSGCGGGGGSSGSGTAAPPAPSPAITPVALAVPAFAAVTGTPVIAPGDGLSGTLALPAAGGVSGTLSIAVPAGAGAPPGTLATVALVPAAASGPAAGIPALQALGRRTAGLGGATITPLYYVGVSWSFAGPPIVVKLAGLTSAIPALPAGAGIALALWDPAFAAARGWDLAFAFGSGAVSVAGTVATFVPPANALTVTPNTTYWLAPYAYPGAAPAPLNLDPQGLAFGGAGAGLAQTLAARQSGSAGPFAAADTCAGIATVAAQPGGTNFAVTPVGAGTCSITITASAGVTATANVVVTITNGIVR
jgi:hypothetical protein